MNALGRLLAMVGAGFVLGDVAARLAFWVVS